MLNVSVVSRPIFRRFIAENSAQNCKVKLDEFYTYYTTKLADRPLIYRPRNANTLVAMDIKDPVTKEPILPKDPIKPLAKNTLTEYIKSMNSDQSMELFAWFKKWTSVSRRKKQLWQYMNSRHIEAFIIQSFFKLGNFEKLLGLIYARRANFINAKQTTIYDIDHFFNPVMMCFIHRNSLAHFNDVEKSTRKLQILWNNVMVKEDNTGLAKLLLDTLIKEQGIDAQKLDVKLASSEISLPPLSDVKEEVMKPVFDANLSNYLVARTLKQFSQTIPIQLENYISEFEALAAKLNQGDIYSEYTNSLSQLWAAKRESKEKNSDGVKAAE